MREVYEFRIREEYAGQLFAPDEGKSLGYGVRKVMLPVDDPRLRSVGDLDKKIRSETERYFFSGWDIYRRYTNQELQSANAFHLKFIHTFEPSGEQCGTEHNESLACPACGAGAVQTSDLRLDLRKAPKTKDIARTIAGEVIVSQRLAELMVEANLKGFEFGRVRHKALYEDDPLDLSETPSGREILLKAESVGIAHASGDFYVWLNREENRSLYERTRQEYAALKRRSAKLKGKPAPVWHQLVPTVFVEVVPPTHTGIAPFDEDEMGEYRCPRGDTLGLNLLSELTVSDSNAEHWDLAATRQYFGARQGVLRPERRLLISPGFWRLLENNHVKGYRAEVVHMDD